MNRDENAWAQAGRYMSLGMMPPAGAMIGYAIGYLLDGLFHTRFLYLVFLVLGAAGGVVGLIRELVGESKADGS